MSNITNPWLGTYQRSYQQIKSKLIEGLSNIKDDNGKIVNYNSDIECKGINLLDYLNQMNIIYEN